MKLNKIICGNAIDVLRELPDNSINCVVTSPPYWGLRDYGDATKIIWDGEKDCDHEWGEIIRKPTGGSGKNANVGANRQVEANMRDGDRISNSCQKCGAWHGALGLEPTPELYIDHLIQIFDEIKRVLRKDGTVWVNIGDTYGGSGCGSWNAPIEIGGKQYRRTCNIDQEYLAPPRNTNAYKKSLVGIPERFTLAMLQAGWIRRNTIIWWKRNCMPSSVKDRFTVDFEYIYFFTKSQKYYFEQQFEPYTEELNRWGGDTFRKSSHKYIESRGHDGKQKFGATSMYRKGREVRPNPKGKNKRCVWDITTKGIGLKHFASFPVKLAQDCITPGCPLNGVVLDPFMGSGTTAIAALLIGREYLGIELNEAYCKMAEKRIQKECGLLR